LHKLTSTVLMKPRDIFPHADTGGVLQLAIVEAERPGVPGADGTAVFNRSFGQICAGVRAGAVEHIHLTSVEEYGQAEAIDFHIFACIGGQFIKRAEGYPGHGGMINAE
jgi:hypothetical protein